MFENLRNLYIFQGISLPSSSGPWSQEELILMLKKIDSSKLSSNLMQVYDKVSKDLEIGEIENDFGINPGLKVNLELLYHTNTAGKQRTLVTGIQEIAFQGFDKWVHESKPFIQIPIEAWVTPHFYGYFEAYIRNNIHATTGNELGAKPLSTNFLVFQNLSLNIALLDIGNFPARAFVSYGTENWYLQIGRERLSWGNGESGNLVMSSNIPQQDMVRFAIFKQNFKYSFLTSFFAHPRNYYNGNNWNGITGWGDYNVLQGLSFYTAHRFETHIFDGLVGLAFTESLMYESEDGVFDFRAFNPLGFNHNNYTTYNSNSILGIEVDWAVAKGINAYAQLLVDEFKFFGEGNERPSAFGYLAGVKTVFSLPVGYLYSSLEGVLTDPYLYIRYNKNQNQTAGYGLDFVVPVRGFSNSLGVYYDDYVIGYKYGNDAAAINLNTKWYCTDKLKLEFNAFSLWHGTFDLWTLWKAGDTSSRTPTTEHPQENTKYPDKNLRNSVSHTLILGLCINYEISTHFSCFAQADMINVKNYANVEGSSEKDFQLVVGASYSL